MSDVVPHPGLLAAVAAADPDDRLPRLVLADWLEENGDPERAEFVRLQCEPEVDRYLHRQLPLLAKNFFRWYPPRAVYRGVLPAAGEQYYLRCLRTFHLGFLDEVAVSRVDDWIGRESDCYACEDAPACPETNVVECPKCDGTGTALEPGVGGFMVRRHPLRRVMVQDRNPSNFYLPGEGEYWTCVGDSALPYVLPVGVYERLPVFSELRRFGRPFPTRIGYASAELATDELSSALILYAKEEL